MPKRSESWHKGRVHGISLCKKGILSRGYDIAGKAFLTHLAAGRPGGPRVKAMHKRLKKQLAMTYKQWNGPKK